MSRWGNSRRECSGARLDDRHPTGCTGHDGTAAINLLRNQHIVTQAHKSCNNRPGAAAFHHRLPNWSAINQQPDLCTRRGLAVDHNITGSHITIEQVQRIEPQGIRCSQGCCQTIHQCRRYSRRTFCTGPHRQGEGWGDHQCGRILSDRGWCGKGWTDQSSCIRFDQERDGGCYRLGDWGQADHHLWG